MIPAFHAAGADLAAVVSSGGLSAVGSGKKFGFRKAATDSAGVLADESIDTIVIATRHDAHAEQVLAALRAGKHVFCEKPLCLTLDELHEIEAEKATRPEQQLMIGFNRRFAPHIIQMKELLSTIDQPKTFIMTINAGDISADHWAQDPEVGGRPYSWRGLPLYRPATASRRRPHSSAPRGLAGAAPGHRCTRGQGDHHAAIRRRLAGAW